MGLKLFKIENNEGKILVRNLVMTVIGSNTRRTSFKGKFKIPYHLTRKIHTYVV